MKAYVDSSVILRIIFGEKNALKFPKNSDGFITSEILKIECFRTIDRMRQVLRISDDDVADRHAALHEAIRSISFIKLTDVVLERACEPFPVVLKTLDAIHLSTALLWKQQKKEDLLFLTHDEQLSKAARSVGFEVLGSSS
ncbi:MAG: hypothetical protein ACD_44C00151G0002 [uncultured bacterium]|nr:MAG: hypothetical protein ACD_44C00151G0002 [uncultured bacterium]OGT23744.1 MAG: hypothetical protein A2W47_06365 [Gammaproteobacteria bacterium RIFCSPHIGHO2_12_38_15]OGT66895.1 MAG: hypothetical protein A3I12_02295 [Gammaproteobacteria bacterium RIFCSPLOWO2_02_FULL_38_11]OGT75837.1 MAG: hypothetical protein A3G71_03075 [Gammaproteobacteria bacterium RIFCSPLOWO2_12_FULL_38_14]